MKKRIMLAIVLGIFLLAGNSWADGLKVGDIIKFEAGSAQQNPGGEFALFLNAGSSSPPNWVFQFETFCVEYNEHISFGSAYKIGGISDAAIQGGVGPAGDPLDLQTRWLFYNFAKGTLSGYDNDVKSAVALQEAIWYFEEEIKLADPGLNAFVVAANKAVSDPNLDKAALAQVKALNVVTLDGGLAQDVLYVSVPEPATMLLLGFGLVGMGVAARRRFGN